jgi:prepilin-type N-terminal cleavage/methylation domain-containing protein/prepilin-type processing-associated H-X9-DG protein
MEDWMEINYRLGPVTACLRRAGFTLVEVLTVIAIVSILAALLTPVFVSAREKSRQSVCASNLSQLYKAVAMYAGDNDGFRPMYEIGPSDIRIDGKDVRWPDQSQDLVQSLKPYGAISEIWFCPDDPLHGNTAVYKRHPATSYSGEAALHTHPTGPPTPWPLLPTRISPSELPVFYDDIMPYMAETPPDTYLYTHDQRFNIVFSDGHVRTMSPHDDDCTGYCH